MKKLYTFVAALACCTTPLLAQSEQQLQFGTMNAAGEFVPVEDGAVLTNTQVEEDFMGDKMISSGLYVRNISGKNCPAQVVYDIESMSGGQHSICFIGTCTFSNKAGKMCYPLLSDKGNIVDLPAVQADETKSLAAEWYVTENAGSCTIHYTLNSGNFTGEYETPAFGNRPAKGPIYVVVGKSTTVTVKYEYDPTGIEGVTVNNPVSNVYYDLSGKRVNANTKGVYIQKSTFANGKTVTRKVVK